MSTSLNHDEGKPPRESRTSRVRGQSPGVPVRTTVFLGGLSPAAQRFFLLCVSCTLRT